MWWSSRLVSPGSQVCVYSVIFGVCEMCRWGCVGGDVCVWGWGWGVGEDVWVCVSDLSRHHWY